MGVGRLGHLAIRFAAKMGAEVVVFSSNPNKERQAMKCLSASEFVPLNELAKVLRPVQTLIIFGNSYTARTVTSMLTLFNGKNLAQFTDVSVCRYFEKGVLARKAVLFPCQLCRMVHSLFH